MGNKTVKDMKQQTGQTNDSERGRRQEAAMGDPTVAPAPSFHQEPEDQMPDRSIFLQIDICKHEPRWPLPPWGPYQYVQIKKSDMVSIVLTQPANMHQHAERVSLISDSCQRV